MKTEDKPKHAVESGKQPQDLPHRALERIRESAGAADRIVHQNTYNVLAAGIVVGFVTGLLVSRSCRYCENWIQKPSERLE
jgi:ElaB/YqjD/DUF883 family membrane-anchored ribosome-binding protein